MATPTNHWKLGLFVVGGLVLAMVTVVYLGAASLRREHISYVTFFDESVQGLDVGSPVKFRGVTVGRVEKIGLAPDRRHVAVTVALVAEELANLGLADGEDESARLAVPPDMRVQLVSQGITGLKFLELDYFPAKDYPPPALSFAPPDRYIPAATSTLKNVEDAVVSASDRLPEMIASLTRVTNHAANVMQQLEEQRLPAEVGATMQRLDKLLASLQGAVDDFDARGISTQLKRGLAGLDGTVLRMNAVLARIDGDKGILASAQRTTDAFGDFAALSPELGQELTETLREIREATASIQRVADALERDPDMLIKGRRVK